MFSKTNKLNSQSLLEKNVLQSGLCTGCGACVGLCPYQVIYNDRTVQLHSCDLFSGKCQAFCPRLEVNLTSLRDYLFDFRDLTPEIGAVKNYYICRAADSRLREIAQHGGTVTALMELALAEGFIESAVVSSGHHGLEQNCTCARDVATLRSRTGSKFIVAPVVAAFNELAGKETGSIGVVATPCQALALAKMKLKPTADDNNRIDKLKLVIGLYCGWTLGVEKFKALLEQNGTDPATIRRMDIPAGQQILEVNDSQGKKLIPFDFIRSCIRESCNYCFDSTAEFADVSVGSARFGTDWKEMRGWNQLIVRTEKGAELIDVAVKRGFVEVREAPLEALKELKKAAAEKKKTALKNIIKKSGSARKLLYLSKDDPLVKRFLKKANG